MVSVEKRPRLDESEVLIPQPDLSAIHRFVVLRVERVGQKVLLTLCCDKTDYKYKCWLTGQWVTTEIEVGDVVNIRTNVWKNEAFEVGTTSGFIVVNPDNMIPSTTVASSLFCARKTWLGDKFKGWGGGNKVMTVGIAVHELLQRVCTDKIYDRQKVIQAMRELITSRSFLHQVYACGMDENEMEDECLRYVPHIMEWLRKYVVGGPSPLHGDEGKGNKVKVLKVVDIEDNIWCHYFGVKGKVDLSTEVEIHEFNGKKRIEVLPLELKTGKTSFSNEHMAQATLYTLMMDERQHGTCSSALLLYLKDGPQMKEVVANTVTKHSLIQRRNDVEYNSRSWKYGPEFKDSEQFCYKCDHLLDCSLMAKNFDEELIESSVNMKKIIPNILAHLTPKHLDFFRTWVTLLNMELEEGVKSSQSSQSSQASGDNSTPSQSIGYQRFWNETASSREKSGLAVGGMKLIQHDGCRYTFKKSPDSPSSLTTSLLTWNPRDRVALSIDDEVAPPTQTSRKRDMIAILTGSVESFNDDSITCYFDKELQKSLEDEVFRIDQMGVSSYSFSSNFSNILRLMIPEDEIAANLRRTIIDLEGAKLSGNLSTEIVKHGKKILKPLTRTQKTTIISILASKTFSLISYKSTIDLEIKMNVITCLVQMIRALDMTVLVTAYSNSNLDEIMTDLKTKGLDVVRIGNKSRADATIADRTDEELTKEMETVAELSSFYESANIIGSTMYSLASHPFYELRKKPFDICLIDQASSMLLTSSILPLFRSRRFVLLGEEKKKPFVRTPEELCPQIPLSLFHQLQTESNTFFIP